MTPVISRRNFLKSGGAVVVAFSASSSLPSLAQGRGSGAAPVVNVKDATLVDSFLAIHADGSVTISTSKVDVGTGLATALRQVAAEELGIPVERFTVIEGDTDTVPDHGGTGGSSGIPRGGADIRRAAATARLGILELGSKRLSKPVEDLTIESGEVRPLAGGQSVSIASLLHGKQLALKINPKVPLKDTKAYTIVGKPVLRTDVPAKVTGRYTYVQDFAVAGMLHARVIRPASIGAKLMAVDESSIRSIPDVKVVRRENFLAVVAADEWAAVRAIRELKVTWSEGQQLPGSENLADYLRSSSLPNAEPALNRGDTAAALASAAKMLSSSYSWPFQSHASLGPSCAVADVKAVGATVWSATQDVFGLRNALGRAFDVPLPSIRVVYMNGSGSYGTNGAWDVAADAFFLSREIGKPVRLQWMRGDELGHDPKGPAQLLEMRGGLDASGNVVAWETNCYAPTGPQWTRALLVQQNTNSAPLAGAGPAGAPVAQNADPPYAVANLRVMTYTMADTPIRLSNLRGPGKIANVFAVESFTDELAAATGIDPVEFRVRGLSDPRAIEVIRRAATMINWQARAGTARRSGSIGRGIAYMRYKQMENYVAVAMEVSVDRATGRIDVRRVACAHDCGLIVNPDGLRNQVEGNILQTLSRTLHEQFAFDRGVIKSVDWVTYPILRFTEAPAVQVELIDRPDQPSYGAGEAASAPVPAALANAVFDAIGVRLRNVPFTPDRVKAALQRV